jgi:hypothetical protein
MISSAAYKHLQKLYDSARTNLDERENEIDGESSSGHHLPKAALDILQGNRSEPVRNASNESKQQQSRSKEKIDSITRDLSNVDVDLD